MSAPSVSRKGAPSHSVQLPGKHRLKADRRAKLTQRVDLVAALLAIDIRHVRRGKEEHAACVLLRSSLDPSGES